MRILVGTQWLANIGGTETYTYALVGELRRRGHQVDLFTFQPGQVSARIRDELGAGVLGPRRYDVVLANHKPVCHALAALGPLIQTCHGVFPDLEQPNAIADVHVAVSEEVRQHLSQQGFEAHVIMNGVDCTRFTRARWPNRELETVLCLAQGAQARRATYVACRALDLSCVIPTSRVWKVESLVWEADVVVGVGRSAYDAMACGRPAVFFDSRDYAEPLSDGYFLDALPEAKTANCSGRTYRLPASSECLERHLERYRFEHSAIAREIALQDFNIERVVDRYLNLVPLARKVRRSRLGTPRYVAAYARGAAGLGRYQLRTWLRDAMQSSRRVCTS